MGIKKGIMFVNKYLKEEKKYFTDLKSVYIGIDFTGMLHRFIRDNINIPDNYILLLINIIEKFKSYGIIPIFVIDGKPVIEKSNKHKQNRSKAKDKLEELLSLEYTCSCSCSCSSSCSCDCHKKKEKEYKLKNKSLSITKEHIDKCKDLFTKLDCIYIHISNCEGDGILALLSKLKIIKYVYSEDFDMFLYPDINYILQSLDYIEDTFKVYNKNELLNKLNITEQQLIDIAFLTGTDYNCGFYKSTLETNLEYIRQYETVENIITNIDLINIDRAINCKILLPTYNFNYELVRQIFTLQNINISIYSDIINLMDTYKQTEKCMKNTLTHLLNIKNVLNYIKNITNDSYKAKKYRKKVCDYCFLHFGMVVNSE
jgi:hypothetical protein